MRLRRLLARVARPRLVLERHASASTSVGPRLHGERPLRDTATPSRPAWRSFVSTYDVAWDDVAGDENDRACRAAMDDDDRGPLLAMFGHIVRSR